MEQVTVEVAGNNQEGLGNDMEEGPSQEGQGSLDKEVGEDSD